MSDSIPGQPAKDTKISQKVVDDLNSLYAKSDYFNIRLGNIRLPKGFVQKPVLRYRKIQDTLHKTPHMLWIETKSYDYYYLHIDEKEYRKFYNFVFLAFFIFIAIALLGLVCLDASYNTSLFVKSIINAGGLYNTTKVAFSVVGYTLIIGSIITVIVFSWFRSTFFHSSLIIFLESDEYQRICARYDSLDKIRNFKHRRIVLLKRMHFINKTVWKEYKIYHRAEVRALRIQFIVKLHKLCSSTRSVC